MLHGSAVVWCVQSPQRTSEPRHCHKRGIQGLIPHQLALVPTTGNKAWLEGGTRRGASGSPWQSPAIVYGTECILRLCNLAIVRARNSIYLPLSSKTKSRGAVTAFRKLLCAYIRGWNSASRRLGLSVSEGPDEDQQITTAFLALSTVGTFIAPSGMNNRTTS
ncbi:uncharacterized protein ASPGLDRAFT_1471524 [Aspergillus glaucus CBS 516.65]|uniref:Uncharacterized protein n=1 Tax=Aspergillus glaucus CBS 516.65 TaxID=1160497 RepID=A0A1L9VLM6_ASPGL|nr:hypothetical protein ASPGLDRAFT_1471524 [Aspergillus glaucus CBS 516.65]OJJ84772.1 hypothetical protein ASPGLDRAFT_1471524 [Aspergillus glaucus CBS 516.65]